MRTKCTSVTCTTKPFLSIHKRGKWNGKFNCILSIVEMRVECTCLPWTQIAEPPQSLHLSFCLAWGHCPVKPFEIMNYYINMSCSHLYAFTLTWFSLPGRFIRVVMRYPYIPLLINFTHSKRLYKLNRLLDTMIDFLSWKVRQIVLPIGIGGETIFLFNWTTETTIKITESISYRHMIY